MSFRPLPILTVLTLISLAILIWLGNWQYGRYSDKLDREPVEETLFKPVMVEVDQSNDGMAQQVYGIVDGEALWRRYVPGRIAGEGPVVLALVDATSGTEPIALAIAEVDDIETSANVFVREATRQGFGGTNQPEADIWYQYDGAAMLERLGYESGRAPQVVEPDTMTVRLGSDVSRTRQTENPYATPVVRDPLPPQRHFGYALTWWGLAIALLGVYVALHHSRGRLRFTR